MNIRGLCPSVFKVITDRKRFFCDLDQSRRVRLICSICKDIMVDPQQLECGCRFCLSCISTQRKTSEEGRCPCCMSLAESGEGVVMRDRAVEREIASLKMVCVNKGCKVKCMLKDLEDHLQGCEFRNERCADCEKEYFHKDLKEHQRRECPMRKVTCVDCGLRMTKEDFRGRHRSIRGSLERMCDQWKGVCPYRCSPERQDSIKDHLRECPKMPVGCDLKIVGCIKVLPRGEMVTHSISDMGQHLSLVVREMENMRNEKEEVEAIAETNKKFGRNYLCLEGVERNLKAGVDVLSTLNDDNTFEDLALIFTLYHMDLLFVLKTEVVKKNDDLSSKMLSLGWKHGNPFDDECLYVISIEGTTLISENDLSMLMEDFEKAKDVDGSLWISLEVAKVPIFESGLQLT